MDDTKPMNQPDVVEATLGSTEYSVPPGGTTVIEVMVTNNSTSGDYFTVTLLGVPPNWIADSGPQFSWIAAGAQGKVALTVRPPDTGEGVIGYHHARLYVFSQNAPDKGKELDFLLKVLAEEKANVTTLLSAESSELTASPGSEVKIPLVIRNLTQDSELLELSIQGVPLSWVALPSPVITLYAGEEKRIGVTLQIPASPDIRAGYYSLKISVLNQKDRLLKAETNITVGIAAYQSVGRIGVMLNSIQFSASPGGTLAVPLTLLNRGLEADNFVINVEGLPDGWVSIATPVNPLRPGETKEISLGLHPPLSTLSQAGRNKFKIIVTSQQNPEQVVRVDCILTIAAYTQVSAELQPQEAQAGTPISVSITNEGNIQQVFNFTCESQGDQLVFEYLEPANQPDTPPVLNIPSGGLAAFKFIARPRKHPLTGGKISYPYQLSINSQQKQAAVLQGTVIDRGLIPAWLIPVVLVLFLCIFFSSIYLLKRGDTQSNTATQTSAAGTALVIGATQTITANQTAAAVAGQQDTDGDGLINQRETEINTDPSNPDTDADGLLDGEEVFQSGTNPLVPDSDGDALKDGEEVGLRTNPLNPDSDGDLLKDGDELLFSTNPLNPDSDSDGLLDGSETPPCPNPTNPDSDQDGIIDGKDINPCDGTNPALTATAAALLPTATAIPPTLPATVEPTQVSLPRFRGMILFESDRDGNPEIYALDDAGQIRRMTDNPSSDGQAAWAPDMQRYAITTNRDGQNEIYLVNVDGSNQVNLTNNPADDQYPAWSVDGNWIVFSSNRDGNYEIYLLNVSSLEVRNLTNNPGTDTQPNWVRSTTFDPSGEFIVFTSDRDGNQEIYRMKTDGTEQLNITNNPANDQMPMGSPDGALVAFTTGRDGNQEVYTMRIDGNGQANLSNNPSNDYGPAWAPDQAWVGFTSERDGNREVYLIKPGTFDLSNLTNNPFQDQISDWR